MPAAPSAPRSDVDAPAVPADRRVDEVTFFRSGGGSGVTVNRPLPAPPAPVIENER